jgi:galactokinase
LRDVNRAMLTKYVLPKDELIFKRGLFIAEEIDRLQKACEDLQNGDLKAHDGLSRMYEVSCKELDFLVDFVRNNTQGVIGARMMGGGFGGCTINLVEEAFVPGLIENISEAYLESTGRMLTSYIVFIDEGTSLVP